MNKQEAYMYMYNFIHVSRFQLKLLSMHYISIHYMHTYKRILNFLKTNFAKRNG
jgi:hypothetical protein